MAITVIKGPDGVREVFTAWGPISQSRSLSLALSGIRIVQEAISGYPERACGVALEDAVSGQVVRVMGRGIVDNVLCASGVLPGANLQTLAASGLASGTGHVATFLSGSYVGAILGKALMSGGKGSGITMLVDLG